MANVVSSPILHLIRRVVEDPRVRQLSDRDLLRRFTDRRDEAAFHTLLRRHGPMVLDVCRGLLGNEADAEDVFQATFLILTRKAASIRNTASVGSWLYGVARRTALKTRAQSATRRRNEARAPARQSSEPDELTWREVRQVLHEELAALSERYRVPLVVCYLEGKTQDEAAAQLGLAKSTLKERLERGRSLLRARLVRRGLGPAAVLVATAWPSVTASACLPSTLVSSTIKAASLFAAGQTAAAGVISPKAAALTEGVLKTVLLTKLQTATAVLLVVAVLSGAAGLIYQTQATEAPAAAETAGKADKDKQPAGRPPRAGAADLSKVDRTFKKEPAYKAGPKYCLLAFGPGAKQRVWLVLDGDTLYVDRKGNGDLTEEGERVRAPAFSPSEHYLFSRERSIEIGDISVGGLTHTGLVVKQAEYRRKAVLPKDDIPSAITEQELQEHFDKIWKQVPDGIASRVYIELDMKCYGLFGDTEGRRVRHMAWVDRNGVLAFAGRPKDAPVVHFGGPLTLYLRPGEKLRRGGEPAGESDVFTGTETSFWLGTAGLGPGTFAVMSHDPVPEGAHPVAEIRFPAKDKGGRPVSRTYTLKSSPANAFFFSPVEVPEGAGLGMAKVTMTFADWKEARVAPATAEIPVVDTAPQKDTKP
jgi:RNA polymerase sigma factor (sigma-70 family)